MLPAQLLVQVADEQCVRLDDTVGDMILLAVDLVLVGNDERVRPFIRTVLNAGAALAGESQKPMPVVVHPHGGDLFLEISQGLAVQFLPEPGQDPVPGIQLERADLDEGEKKNEGREPPAGNLAAGKSRKEICDGQWEHPLSNHALS